MAHEEHPEGRVYGMEKRDTEGRGLRGRGVVSECRGLGLRRGAGLQWWVFFTPGAHFVPYRGSKVCFVL